MAGATMDFTWRSWDTWFPCGESCFYVESNKTQTSNGDKFQSKVYIEINFILLESYQWTGSDGIVQSNSAQFAEGKIFVTPFPWWDGGWVNWR